MSQRRPWQRFVRARSAGECFALLFYIAPAKGVVGGKKRVNKILLFPLGSACLAIINTKKTK